jgi:hypothetical protein
MLRLKLVKGMNYRKVWENWVKYIDKARSMLEIS